LNGRRLAAGDMHGEKKNSLLFSSSRFLSLLECNVAAVIGAKDS
jgi:hypothetical protein